MVGQLLVLAMGQAGRPGAPIELATGNIACEKADSDRRGIFSLAEELVLQLHA